MLENLSEITAEQLKRGTITPLDEKMFKHLSQVSDNVMNLLIKETEGPNEAFAILTMCLEFLKDEYGIADCAIISMKGKKA